MRLFFPFRLQRRFDRSNRTPHFTHVLALDEVLTCVMPVAGPVGRWPGARRHWTLAPELALSVCLVLAALLWPFQAGARMLISQVHAGNSPNGPVVHDYVDLHNTGPDAVDLTGWSLQYTSAGGHSWARQRLPLHGRVAPGATVRITLAGTADAAVSAHADPTQAQRLNLGARRGQLLLARTDHGFTAACPLHDARVVDLVGWGHGADCAEGGHAAPAPGRGQALARRVQQAAAADPETDSARFPDTTGPHGPATCQDSDDNAADFTAVPATPGPDAHGGCGTAVAAGASPLAVSGANTGDSDGVHTGHTGHTEIGLTPIARIQGSGARSPLEGRRVRTQGVVTRLNGNGFFLQDPVGDGDAATSEGLFVYTGAARYDAVTLGAHLRVTGQVAEHGSNETRRAGNGPPRARRRGGNGSQPDMGTLTELKHLSELQVLAAGSAPPAITPVRLRLPVADAQALERVEGMLVAIDGPLTVQDNHLLARYGQLVLGAGGRHMAPTHRHRPGPDAQALARRNALSRIVLDDGSSLQNPVPVPHLRADGGPRVGDALVAAQAPSGTGALKDWRDLNARDAQAAQPDTATMTPLVGVIDQGPVGARASDPAGYRLHPTRPPHFAASHGRTAQPPAVGGTVTVAAFNVLNFFTAWRDGGGSARGCEVGGRRDAGLCRGADNASEFQRQQAKLVAALVAIGADVFGLMEVQNNGNHAAQSLADALNAHLGHAAYAVTALPRSTGSDAIRVALLYRPQRLRAIGPPASDGHALHSRPPLAQVFEAPGGARFTVVVAHLKSKGGCPEPGDRRAAGNREIGAGGPGCWNARRVQQARRLQQWMAGLRRQGGPARQLLIGDLNAYPQEDPVRVFTQAGFTDEIDRRSPDAHTYVYAGASGRLDHALASPELTGQVSGAAVWAINADETPWLDYNREFKAPERRCGMGRRQTCATDTYTPTPWRSSDHDPVIVGLDL